MSPVPGQKENPLVHIIILNWNGWGDTVECLESVLRCDYADFRVVVCDNASTDGSLERIKAWADGRLDVRVRRGGPIVEPAAAVLGPSIEGDIDVFESDAANAAFFGAVHPHAVFGATLDIEDAHVMSARLHGRADHQIRRRSLLQGDQRRGRRVPAGKSICRFNY